MKQASRAARALRCIGGITAAGLCAASCGGAGADDDTVLVLAAASLATVFTELGEAAEAAHPELEIDLSFAGSSTLRVQLEQGAPGDVIALADPRIMEALEAADLVSPAHVFAVNSLSIAVPAGNPGGVESIDDFTRSDLVLGLCASPVPCGRYADEVFAAVGVEPAVDTREPDVASLSAKVASGELDGGMVYDTDVIASDGRLIAIDLPAGSDVEARYPIAISTESDQRDAAERFVDFVRSDDGQAILTAAGFGAP